MQCSSRLDCNLLWMPASTIVPMPSALPGRRVETLARLCLCRLRFAPTPCPRFRPSSGESVGDREPHATIAASRQLRLQNALTKQGPPSGKRVAVFSERIPFDHSTFVPNAFHSHAWARDRSYSASPVSRDHQRRSCLRRVRILAAMQALDHADIGIRHFRKSVGSDSQAS